MCQSDLDVAGSNFANINTVHIDEILYERDASNNAHERLVNMFPGETMNVKCKDGY